MQKQDYAGLSRTFDAYFPDVKGLVEKTEQFYKTNHTDTERWCLTDYDNVRLIGTFTLNKNDDDVTLPRLYFKKEAEMTNPAFYVITRPSLQGTKERIIHIGTSVEAAAPYACSVSALTGGIIPHIEKGRAFATYLKIMSYVKKYGCCTVYELQTGYDNICIKGINGTTLAKETFAKQIFNFVNCDESGYKYNDDPFRISSQAEHVQWQEQHERNCKIWDAVISFKNMIENASPEMLKVLEQLRQTQEKKKEDDYQEITAVIGGEGLTVKFKNHIDFVTWDEYNEMEKDKFDKIVPTSAKILCQTGDTVYEQYTSYIAKKFREADNEVNIKAPNFYTKQEALQWFEQTIIDHTGPDTIIEYANIYMGAFKHAATGYRLTADGTESRIMISKIGKPSFQNIGKIIDEIMMLFDLDPKTTKITYAL